MAAVESLDALGVEGGIGGDEVHGDFDHVRGGRRIVERRREDAVECADAVAARIEHYAAGHAQPPRERLGRIEGAGAGADYYG